MGVRTLLFAPILLFLSVAATATDGPAGGAQSMTVIGGDSGARDCFDSASIAARRDYAAPGSVAECTRALEHGRLTERDRMATFVNRGILYLAQRKLDLAAADFDAAIVLDPSSGEAFVDRGNLSFMRGQWQGAVDDYTKALELGMEKDYIAYFNRAMAHEHLRHYREARGDYQRAVLLAPEWHQARLRLEALVLFDPADAAPQMQE